MKHVERGSIRLTLTLVLAIMLVGSAANAADQAITGKRLLLKPSGKLVLLSKDASVSITGSDPVGGADSSVSFDDGSGPVTFSLPKTLWSTNGSGTLFKYKNSAAPAGPSVVKIAKVKPGLLKVVAKGLPFGVPAGTASIDVVFSLDGGTNRYCMTFTGTGDGSKFLVKDAAAGTCPPPPPTPTATPTPPPTATPTTPCLTGGVGVGGFCWFLGALDASCDDTCTGMGLTCSPGTISYAGSGGTSAQCEAVLSALSPGLFFGGDLSCTAGFSVGCAVGHFNGGITAGIRCTDPPTDCAGLGLTAGRACACQ
jgi:hypothetical protein